MGMPCQNLTKLFPRDCAMNKRRPEIHSPAKTPARAKPDNYFFFALKPSKIASTACGCLPSDHAS